MAIAERELVVADSVEEQARELEEFLRAHAQAAEDVEAGSARVKLVMTHSGAAIDVPDAVYGALLYLVHHMARGEAISLAPLHKRLTTQEAADVLGVSRPFLVKLLDEGAIPYTKTGTHRRIKLADILEYRERQDRAAREALTEMARDAQDLGIYY